MADKPFNIGDAIDAFTAKPAEGVKMRRPARVGDGSEVNITKPTNWDRMTPSTGDRAGVTRRQWSGSTPARGRR